jgi:AcrR family transcriptional regulator
VVRAATRAQETSKGDITRRHIKDVIARLAKERPLSKINLAEICSAAGLTTGALYFHFGGKEQAIQEMVIDEIRGLYARMLERSGDTFEHCIRGATAAIADYMQNNGRLPRAVYTTIGTKAHVGQAWLKIRRPLLEKIAALIAAAREAKQLSAEPGAFLAHFILNSIEDLSMDLFQWHNTEFALFASSSEEWQDRQCALWGWAILAPFHQGPGSAPSLRHDSSRLRPRVRSR